MEGFRQSNEHILNYEAQDVRCTCEHIFTDTSCVVEIIIAT